MAAVFVMTSALPARAGSGQIRDSEIENLLRDYSRPIFKTAGLYQQNVQIHLIGARSYNAFVIDGRNMFFHAGTLLKSETPNQVIGVIAHETGHIAGGHLSRLRQTLSNARSTAFMMRVLILAATAAGAAAGADVGAAGVGAMLGSDSITQRQVLKYRRTEEASADQAALAYLNATGQSARGMLQTFAYLAEQGAGSLRYADPYLQSHPLPAQRIAQLRHLAKASPYFNRRDKPELQARHDMMRAKLSGFLDNPQTVLNRYPASDQSLPARYARAIASFVHSGVDAFLPQIDALIALQPNNPYFHELKGENLYKDGRTQAAIAPLRTALQLAPNEPLTMITLARALYDEMVITGRFNPQQIDEVISLARKAMVKERCSSETAKAYDLLTKAYENKGLKGDSLLASAYLKLLRGDNDGAKSDAEKVKAQYSPGTRNWLKADDILTLKPSRC